MKICIVHNEYSKFSGEEVVVSSQLNLLESNGHQVSLFSRSSSEIEHMHLGQIIAFFTGINNFAIKKTFKEHLNKQKPDIVHVHNLYPLISPSVLETCRAYKLPVVMTLHNYRLICPTGLFMSKRKFSEGICERCASGKEYWCVIRNCEGSIFKSFGYALRNYHARARRMYLNNVTCYAALTDFQRQKLFKEGYPRERIFIVPNMSDLSVTLSEEVGNYIGFIGRISPEKSISTLVSAAKRTPDISYKAAGEYEEMISMTQDVPRNFKFIGQLERDQVKAFFLKCRAIVLCSTWYEGFPMILIEAMHYGKPVIASRIGGIPEIVEEGVTGLLFEPGNGKELSEKVRYLWEHPDLCKKMGNAGQQKALQEYSPEKYYSRLMGMYKKTIQIYRNS